MFKVLLQKLGIIKVDDKKQAQKPATTSPKDIQVFQGNPNPIGDQAEFKTTKQTADSTPAPIVTDTAPKAESTTTSAKPNPYLYADDPYTPEQLQHKAALIDKIIAHKDKLLPQGYSEKQLTKESLEATPWLASLEVLASHIPPDEKEAK